MMWDSMTPGEQSSYLWEVFEMAEPKSKMEERAGLASAMWRRKSHSRRLYDGRPPPNPRLPSPLRCGVGVCGRG